MGTGYPRRWRAIPKIGLNNEDCQHGNPDKRFTVTSLWPLSLDTSGNEAEIGVPSRDDELSSFSGNAQARLVYRWNPQLQAEWTEKMFTVLMSRPYVSGIAWYDLIDRWSFLPGGGPDRSWRPKPVYRRLEQVLAKAGRIRTRSGRDGPRALATALE
jgi:hypothetical protein